MAGARRASRVLIVAAAMAAALVTVGIVVIPNARFAYENASLHVALETAEAIIGVLLAFFAYGRLRLEGRAADLLLAWAFGILAATNLLLAAGPNVALQARAVGWITWSAAGLRLLGAAGIAAAARLNDRVVSEPLRRQVTVVGCAGIVAVPVLALLADVLLGPPIDPTIEATASTGPLFVGHTLLELIQLVGVVLLALGAIWFGRAPERGGLEDVRAWFAAGCVLGAFSRVHYFLFVSLYTSWVSTGDLLRLASYLAFAAGASFEVRSYWRAQVELGATLERGRIARDLHDGLAQELSFIRSHTIEGGPLDAQRSALVADAAGRAMLESRRLIRLLHDHTPVADALREAVAAAERSGVAVDLDIRGSGVDGLDVPVQNALVRVVREAATNAVRHGGAQRLNVVLDVDGDGGGALAVEDDGAGFDPGAPTEGFGLIGMRARANEINGTLEVTSAAGSGTTVALRW